MRGAQGRWSYGQERRWALAFRLTHETRVFERDGGYLAVIRGQKLVKGW